MPTWVCATCGPVPAGAIRHLDHDSPHGHERHECGSSAGLDWTKKEHEMSDTSLDARARSLHAWDARIRLLEEVDQLKREVFALTNSDDGRVVLLESELNIARNQAARQLTELNQLRAHECVPTKHAYDAACAALHKHRDRADTLSAVLDQIGDQAYRFGAAGDRNHMQDVLLSIQARAKEAVAVDKRVRENPPTAS